MDAELFYQLLVGELQLSSGDAGAGFSLMLDAARKTQHPELYRRAVQIALQARSGDSALGAARAWTQASPQDPEPHRFVLQILVALNRPSESSDTLRALVELTPVEQRNEVIAAIPQILERTSDKSAALQAVTQALQSALKDPVTAAAAWSAIGRMQLSNNQSDLAFESAQRGQAAEERSIYPALLALELMDRRQEGAEALVQRHLQTEKPDADEVVRQGYARALINQQRFREALRQLQITTAQHPDTADAWLMQGMLLVQENRLDAARASLETFLELSRHLPISRVGRGQTQAYLQLARIAEKQGNFIAANAWLDRIDNPQDVVDVQLQRATLLARQGQMEQARQLLREQPERTPEDARRNLLAEAQLLREFGQYEAALKVYEQATVLFPDDADLIYEQAMVAEKAGHPDLMERLLRHLIDTQPDYHHAYNALGYALADRGERLMEAKTLIQKALEFAPNDPYIQDSLGWVEFRMGHLSQASRILQAAYDKRPDAEIAAHLGEVLWTQDLKEKALKIWREGLLLNPGNATLQQTLKRLKATP